MTFSHADRPERKKIQADEYYNPKIAAQYTSASNEKIQSDLTNHVLHLLNIKEDSKKKQHSLLILDLGCGSGFSLRQIQLNGHIGIGCDIAKSMLNFVSKERQDSPGIDVFQANFGQGLPFRREIFDAAISISALQWICADANLEKAKTNLFRFFEALYTCLVSESKAVFQIYPDGRNQAKMIQYVAKHSGFHADFIVDYPHRTSAKKWFLCLKKQLDPTFIPNCSCQIRCPLATSYDSVCAISWWKRLQSSFSIDYSINSTNSTNPTKPYNNSSITNLCIPENNKEFIAKIIQRLYHEHIQSANHLLRATKRAESLHLSSLHMHEKAKKALQINDYRKGIAQRLIVHYGSSPTLSDLKASPEKLIQLLHETTLCELHNMIN